MEKGPLLLLNYKIFLKNNSINEGTFCLFTA